MSRLKSLFVYRTTVTYIEKSLPLDSVSLWKQRGNIDHIILLDWNSRLDQVQIGKPLQTLKDALFKVRVVKLDLMIIRTLVKSA